MFVSNALLLVVSVVVLAARVVAAAAALPDRAAVRGPGQHQVPARLERAPTSTVRDRIGITLSHLQEGIAGVRVIQAFGREDVEVDRFGAGNRAPLRRPHALGEDLRPGTCR